MHGSYRHAISEDSSAFKEQLPFYQIRPVYTGCVYILYRTGINIGFATHIISGIAVVAALPFLYLMSVSFLAKPFIYAVPPLGLIFGVPDLGRLSTPDGLAFFAVVLAAYLYLKKRITPLVILLPMMLGIRTDLILFALPLLFSIFVCERNSRWKALLTMLVCVAIYFGIGAYWSNAGWSTIFYCTFVERQTNPISVPPTLTAQQYFLAIVRGGVASLLSKSFILYVVAAGYSCYLVRNQAQRTSIVTALNSSAVSLSVVCLVFVVSHFVAFPLAWDRFFCAPYLIGAFCLLAMLTECSSTANPAPQG